MSKWKGAVWLALMVGLAPHITSAEAVGGYAAGCQFSSQALPGTGTGFHVIRASRERFYGQPVLIDYLHNLGKKVERAELPPMLVADMAKQRGGPFNFGHRSHQTGLDADIWLRTPPKPVSSSQLEQVPEIDMVNHKLYILNSHFQDQQRQLIALAAQDERVSRIFVHPLIKQAMCHTYGDAPWLNRLRPWYGHSGHFHVRLQCPKADIHCVPQAPVPAGTGCDRELHSWLKDKTGALSGGGSTTPFRPALPPRCQSWVPGY
ncbi:penicillin-insensitive murein endopeptidase [Oceanisphaera profunda]|uniref:Penicillin-insensitive murein endopeptidase n=1 Tax=Oceanisphaera profunda TaxID=1416627 RepID=A0A1Y0D9G7_9GAMM|nr:penicillin-insensitive murein endopeptidase [Oceanisphaera profunda]ART83766.1 penicillin-insensitive murein endopeptidase [Oceanisphaera profunda]